MILEHVYENYAWGRTKTIFRFDVENKKVFYSKNTPELKLIGTIENHEQTEMLSAIGKITNLNFQFESKRTGFDAGKKEYYLILNSLNKIKLGQKGNYTETSNSVNINRLVDLIDKYVKLAIEIIPK